MRQLRKERFKPLDEPWRKGSRPARVSPGLDPAAGLGGKLVCGGKIFLFEVGMLIENLSLRHAGAQPPEDIPHCNA